MKLTNKIVWSTVMVALLSTFLLTACGNDDCDEEDATLAIETATADQIPQQTDEIPTLTPPPAEWDDEAFEPEGFNQATATLLAFGSQFDEAIKINDVIYQARGVANAMMVVTPEGNVVFDTGLPWQGQGLKDKLQAIDDGPVKYVILSHAQDEGAEIITHREFPRVQKYLIDLEKFQWDRNKMWYGSVMPEDPPEPGSSMAGDPANPTILVDDVYSFELGGIRFEVIATPGAEGIDSVSLWLPDYKALFTGDFFGPLFPMFPNLNTIRSEPIRDPIRYIDSLNRMIELEPEVIIPSHLYPIKGKKRIMDGMVLTRDAVQYVYDETIVGMNVGKDVYTLMEEITLPPELEIHEGHGKVSWGVHAIYELYQGWFYFDSTADLYTVPAMDVYPQIVEMAGGADAVAASAADRLSAGEHLEALRLVEMALAAEPGNKASLQVRLDALNILLDESGAGSGLENFSEVGWLEAQTKITKEALSE